ncbi:MAG TPA: hypothetical protein DEO86_09620 [Colwellia sp.]|nr:hypothetical protein [Colwellia sp.]|tara:strand:+ start:6344 stop:7372 length:1029 start_codon:yes stop_codon:yes gene_type:complete
MEAYFIFTLSITLSLLAYKQTKIDFFLFIPFLIAAVFAGLRYDVGIDYQSYVDNFNYILKGYPSDFEFINKLIIELIHSVGGDVQVYFMFCAVLTNFFVYHFIKKHSQSVITSSVLYFFITFFFFASLNGVRQYLAIAIFLFSLRYILSKEIYKYAFIIVCASLFHTSAILFLPLYFIIGRKYSTVELCMYGGLAFVFLVIALQYLAGMLFHTSYLTQVNQTTPRALLIGFSFINIYLIFLVKNTSKEVNLFRNLLFISLVLIILVLFYPQFSMGLMRLNGYFLFALIPMLSYLPKHQKIKMRRVSIILPIITVSYLYFFYIIAFKGEQYNLVPYTLYLGWF